MFRKKWPPIDITRKYEKLCIVAFNRKFDYDDVIKMKNKSHNMMNCYEDMNDEVKSQNGA